MKTSFSITLVNLEPDASRAVAGRGRKALGALPKDDVVSLFERFRAIDPTENAQADPEIIIEVRRTMYVVRTSAGKLFLNNPRKFEEPTLVLTAEEIIGELDGSAAAARAQVTADAAAEARAKQANEADAPIVVEAPPITSVLRLPHRIGLAAAALCFSGYLAYAISSSNVPADKTVPVPIADAKEVERCREDLAGIYLTGSQPGEHGINLARDGTMKLFQLNAQGAPGVLQDAIRLGRIDGQLCGWGSQTSGTMRFTEQNVLVFWGETYRRIR